MKIKSVHDLAHIPASPFGSNDHVLASEVYSVNGSTRKKRLEIVLAVDQNSIGIYDVCHWRLQLN